MNRDEKYYINKFPKSEYIGINGKKILVSDYLAKGGNGYVFRATVDNAQGYVIKILKPTTTSKRKERFTREVNAVCRLHEICNDCKILKIIDYNFSDEENEEDDFSWYVMPEAESIKKIIEVNGNFEERLKIVCELANIVKFVHDAELAHRDIKPSNILVKENEYYLSDFGLVWEEGNETLTSINEEIGPRTIRPPEATQGTAANHLDSTQKSLDIYLLGKTIWMILTKSYSWCFRGHYVRNWENVSLTKEMIAGKEELEFTTLEPLHILLEETTEDQYVHRKDINRVIQLLKDFKACNFDNNQELIKQYREIEFRRNILARNKSKIVVYRENKTIANILINNWSGVLIESKSLGFTLMIAKIEFFSEEKYIFKLVDDRDNNYYLTICEVIVPNANYKVGYYMTLKTSECQALELEEYDTISDLIALQTPGIPMFQTNSNIVVDEGLELVVRYK